MDRDTAEPAVTSFPGRRAAAYVRRYHEAAAPSTHVYPFVWDHTAPATGPFCTDVDGNVLMDFAGHVGSAPLGYNHPGLRERLAEFDLVDPLKIAGQDFYVTAGQTLPPSVPGPMGLMERLVEVSDHYDMDTVFLSNSGAEAVENAMKIAYDHTDGHYGITFQGGFHGRTLGALSVNRSKAVYRHRFPEVAGIHDAPFCTDRDCSPDTCDCGFFTDEGSALDRMLSGPGAYVPPADVAFVMVEPIQGEGGYRIPSDAFMSAVDRVCRRHDIPLIVDEVQSGLGRTGEMWAADGYPIEPDVIASAKGLRVGATISRSEIFPAEQRRLSSTWGSGDVLGSAVGAATLDVVREADLPVNARRRGEQAVAELSEASLPGAVDVRGAGLMLAVEWASPDRRDEVRDACLQHGLLTLGCGTRTTRLIPPLDVTDREISLGVSLLATAARSSA